MRPGDPYPAGYGYSNSVIYVASHGHNYLVQALYHRNALLRRALRALFLAEIIIMTLLFAMSMPNMKYGAYCVIVDFPSKTAPAFLYVVVAFGGYILTVFIYVPFKQPISYHLRVHTLRTDHD